MLMNKPVMSLNRFNFAFEKDIMISFFVFFLPLNLSQIF